MTVTHLTSVILHLVVFLSTLMKFQSTIGHADPRVAVVFYIFSKLLPRFEELSNTPPI